MSCDEVLTRLDDYVDGALPEREAAEVERHLASCPPCREEERSLRSLLATAAALPREMAPARDLWPGVAERIGARRARWRMPLGLAAAAAVVILAGSSLLRREGPVARGPAAVTVAGEADPLRAAEADYERATAALLATLQSRRGSLSPETLASLERNLAVIDRAMTEVREALRREPENPGLTRMLVSTHQKKVDVLRRMVKLSTPIQRGAS